MKKDVNDLKKDVQDFKKMFFEILQNPAMTQHIPVYTGSDAIVPEYTPSGSSGGFSPLGGQPVFINKHPADIQHIEAEDESLSIMDKEKELIIKALKKHRGKRKDAASDLGISERTLYRKLKEYDIEDL
jgi:DNA-binding NtrC family response regulator